MTDEEQTKLAAKLDRVIKELSIIRRVLVIGLVLFILNWAAAILLGFLAHITSTQVVKVGSEVHQVQ